MRRVMEPRHPDFRNTVEEIFYKANFVRQLGVKLAGIQPGVCETELPILEWHRQQDGFIHAGVQATLADHTAGGAAASMLAPGELVLTSEFKINLLNPASGDLLACRAEVLKAGKTLSIVEAEVFDRHNGAKRLVAKLLATMAVLQRR